MGAGKLKIDGLSRQSITAKYYDPVMPTEIEAVRCSRGNRDGSGNLKHARTEHENISRWNDEQIKTLQPAFANFA